MGLGKKSITYLVTLGWENPDGVERDMTGQVGWIIFYIPIRYEGYIYHSPLLDIDRKKMK